MSDPQGEMKFVMLDREAVVRYRSATKTAEFLFYARCGVYIGAQKEEEGRFYAIANVIVLWNTIYMDAVIDQLRSEGYPLKPEDVRRLSPLMFEHINFLGRYAFALPDSVAQGQLLPLRSAEESDNE